MPLRKGTSRAVISYNIRKMQKEGYSHDRAVAAALRTAGVKRKIMRRKNPIPKFLQNPLVWILGGGAAAAVGYALLAKPAPAQITSQQQIDVWQAELAA
jgi:hypothetical protein